MEQMPKAIIRHTWISTTSTWTSEKWTERNSHTPHGLNSSIAQMKVREKKHIRHSTKSTRTISTLSPASMKAALKTTFSHPRLVVISLLLTGHSSQTMYQRKYTETLSLQSMKHSLHFTATMPSEQNFLAKTS